MASPQAAFAYTRFEQDLFWQRRRDVVRTSTLPVQRAMLKETGRYVLCRPPLTNIMML